MRVKYWAALAAAASFALSLAAGAQAQQTTLIVATLTTEDSLPVQHFFIPWAQAVEKSANGALKMDIRNGYTIASLNNSLDRLNEDVVQVVGVFHGNTPGRFPLSEVAGLPFMTTKAEDSAVALWRLYKTGLLDGELKDFVPLAMCTYGFSGLHLVKKPPTLNDLKGLKIVTATKIQADMLSLLGASPSSATPMDAYTALQRGTYDGIMTSWGGVLAFHINDVTSFHVDAALGTSTEMLAMTKKRYDALPPAARKAIDENSGEAATRWMASQSVDALIPISQAQAREKGGTIVNLTPAQQKLWEDKTKSVIDAWVAARPNGGAAVLTKFREILADVQAGR
ncbi:MAG TPA: TRAP transporter substrate-binding protein [Stellaceae bacterium]|nr:TRAP transporter substrate-binding protein [Stellaceae bacterium]